MTVVGCIPESLPYEKVRVICLLEVRLKFFLTAGGLEEDDDNLSILVFESTKMTRPLCGISRPAPHFGDWISGLAVGRKIEVSDNGMGVF